MAPPALLPMAALTAGTGRPLAPPPARPHVVVAARTPHHPARTASPMSLVLCTPRSDGVVVDAASGSGGSTGFSPEWPWGEEEYPPECEEKVDFFDIHEQFVRESTEAWAALKAAAADVPRALVDNFNSLRSLRTHFDIEDYHIGMPFGALIVCIGCYQLWKLDPSTFLDVALGYTFYKLSVLASDVRRRGFSNDLLGRLKFVIVVVMATKDFRKNLAPIDAIRTPVYFLYLGSFLSDLTGLKKYIKFYMAAVVVLIKTKEGRRVLARYI